jgi:Fe-S-cluster containining protein
VSDAEAAAIADHLQVPLGRFYEVFTRRYRRVPGWHLLANDEGSGALQSCIFLRPDNTCRIHAARPVQCRTYPWWPELMDARQWRAEAEQICEGFDHPDAPPTDLAEAARQLRTATAHDAARLLATPPPKKKKDKGGGAAAAAATAEGGAQRRPQWQLRDDEWPPVP